MEKKYTHITLEERKEIHLLAAGVSLVEIAVRIDVNKSTISREIKRNSEGRLGYNCYGAQAKVLVEGVRLAAR